MAGRDEVVITGVCAAGKSTLARRLRETGIAARTVAQEHSCIPDLWRWSGAGVTIYLHASFEAVKRRRRSFMHLMNYEEQLHRLRHAREEASLRLDTSHLTSDEVFGEVVARLRRIEGNPHMPVPDEPGSEDGPPEGGGEDIEREDNGFDAALPDLPIPDEL